MATDKAIKKSKKERSSSKKSRDSKGAKSKKSKKPVEKVVEAEEPVEMAHMASDSKSKKSKKSKNKAGSTASSKKSGKSKKSKKDKTESAAMAKGDEDDAPADDAAMDDAKAAGGPASGAPKKKPSGPVDVPYGQPFSVEEQTKMVVKNILDGLKEVITDMVAGQNKCEDRDEIDPFCNKLQQQAQKIVEAIQKDAVYVEEARHHHNRIPDLCDITRDYNQGMMVADLKRATAIRREVLTVIRGKAPDYELDADECDELRSVRNMLRRQFGGKKEVKIDMAAQKKLDEIYEDAIGMGMGTAAPSEIHAVTDKTILFGDFEKDADAFENEMREANLSNHQKLQEGGAGEWAKDLVSGKMKIIVGSKADPDTGKAKI